MGSEKNAFGGGNPNAVYTPMSEDEQEVLARLVAEDDFHVHLVGWGWITRPKVSFGDLRVQIPISITFVAPDIPQPVYSFRVELWARGFLLFAKDYAVGSPDGGPLMVHTGYQLTFVWEIAVRSMDPNLVRALKPGATGLTSRWMDRDTKDFTLTGNNRLSPEAKDALVRLRQGEKLVQGLDLRALKKARKKEGT